MFDRLFHVIIEVAIFCGLVVGTLFVTKIGFDYLFQSFEITPFSKEAYGYITTVYSFIIAVLILKIDIKYRKIQSLRSRIDKLKKDVKHIEDDEHNLKEEIVKVIA